jgi:hypothetical protein
MSSINFKRLCAKNIGIKYILKTNSGIPVAKIDLEIIMEQLRISLANHKIKSFVLYQKDFISENSTNSANIEVCLTAETRFDFTSNRMFSIPFFKNYPQSEFKVEVRSLRATNITFDSKSEVENFYLLAANNYSNGAMAHISLLGKFIPKHKTLLARHPLCAFGGNTFFTFSAGSVLMVAEY